MQAPTAPAWIEGLDPLLAVAIVGLLPGLEPRYAVILGAYMGLGLDILLLIGVAQVLLLSTILTLSLEALDKLLAKAPLIGPVYTRYRARALSRASRSVEKWGRLGLALFVAIPLPATGIYTGALAGLLLGLRGSSLLAPLIIGGLASIALTLTVSGIVF